MCHIVQLANQFSTVLRTWLTDEDMQAIVERNNTPEYITKGICATHEYCDPNQAIIDAFAIVEKREPVIWVSFDELCPDMNLMDVAWGMASGNEFKQIN